jgi:hypothetical protein
VNALLGERGKALLGERAKALLGERAKALLGEQAKALWESERRLFGRASEGLGRLAWESERRLFGRASEGSFRRASEGSLGERARARPTRYGAWGAWYRLARAAIARSLAAIARLLVLRYAGALIARSFSDLAAIARLLVMSEPSDTCGTLVVGCERRPSLPSTAWPGSMGCLLSVPEH